MDQVNYKGYARSIGFDPIRAPYEALNKMQERDSRTIRGMEENRRAIKEVRDQYGAGLERKQSLEMQDRDKQHKWSQELAANRQQAIERNAQTAIQSELQKGKNAESVLTSLSKFSTTISDSLTEFKKQRDESDMLDGYMEAAASGLPMNRQQDIDNTETLLATAGKAQDKIVDGLQARGADPYVVSSLLSGNKARDYGRLKAYSEMAAGEFPGWAQSKLDEQGLSTAADRTAAMKGLFGEFLQQNGLFGLKADFMAPALMKMRQSYNTLIGDARKADIVSKSQLMRDDALENLFRGKSGQTLVESFDSIARSYDEDGRTPIGMTKARQLVMQELRDTTRYSNEDVTRILSEAMTDQGSWRDRFGRDYDDLLKARRQDTQAEFNLNQAEEAQYQKEAEKQLLEFVKDSWNGDETSLQEIIKDAKTQGIPTDRLQAYLAYSNQQKNSEFWNQELEEAYDQGLLTLDTVDQPGVPLTVRQKWRQLAQEQESTRTTAGIKQEDLKTEFSGYLKNNLIGDSTTRTAHSSLTPATNAALRMFNQNFKSYSTTMDPAAAAQKAKIDVINHIQNGAVKGDKQGSGIFAVIPSYKGTTGQAFFAGFTPGNHANAPKGEVFMQSRGVPLRAAKNPGILDTEVLISSTILKDIDNRVASGKPISMPEMYTRISKLSGLTTVDVLNRQLRAAGLNGQVQPGFRNQLSQINDPRLQSILRQSMTQDRLNTAIIGGGHVPATIRQGGSGFQDVIAITNAAGFKHPAVAAAMWALESGWGKNHSGKNNVFNIKAQPGQGTMMPSPEGNGKVYNSWWRDYPSVLESAKDFTNLMTNSRYAGGVQAAQTPRQAIQAIIGAGYATDPKYVNKVVDILKAQGINPDQVYSAAPPARNPTFMRPTLAYITGNIGPTSTGEHLDVKQQDNPNTPGNEFGSRFGEGDLDKYVFVKDPQFGNVPIGTLRQKLPGRGDSFDQHVARGSHGIDYPTAKGTQLFVQNGARVVSKQRTQHGDKVVIQLPDGRRFSFLHGTSV
jgi:hypothetical protein